MGGEDFDLIIIGAGAAGIAAGLVAQRAGLSARLLEAAPHIGGRAHTVSFHGVPFDLGCHYIHHAGRNPFGAIALARDERVRFDLHALDTPSVLVRAGRQASDDERDALAAYYEAAFDVFEHEAPADVAISELIDTSHADYPLLQAWMAAHYGSHPERMSALDAWMLEDLDYDWPVANGYGALIASLGAGLDVALETPVHTVTRTRRGVTVQTSRGPLTARAALVTVSTEVLKAGGIRFEPGLPDDVTTAFEGVPLGHAERIGLRTDGPLVEQDDPFSAHVLFDDDRALQLYFHEFGEPLVTVYMAGDLARELATEGPDATIDVAERALVDVLGSDAPRRIVDRITSGWTVDPLIRGGYSIALPGRAADRAVLARPFDERIRLAGEACSREHFGTAHGAWSTGAEAVSDWIAEEIFG